MPRPLLGYLLPFGAAPCFSTLGLASRAFYDDGGDAFMLVVLRFVALGPALLSARVARKESFPPLRGCSGRPISGSSSSAPPTRC
jgi:hypothetical protein